MQDNPEGEVRDDEVDALRAEARLIETEAIELETVAVVLGAEAEHLEVEADRLEHERRVIHFKVDGDPYETRERSLTANQILAIAKLNPTLRYLEEVAPTKRSFKDDGNKEIEMINDMIFISLSVGPTPTS